MINFILGLLAGFTFTIWYVLFDSKWGFDSNISVNIVIASAAVVATFIHYDASKNQRRDRIWEINKDILLEFSGILAKMIQDLEKATDYHFDEMQGIAEETGRTHEHPRELYTAFSQKKFEVLNVYEPLMHKDLIQAIGHLDDVSMKILKEMDDGRINVFEAFDIDLKEHQELQQKLNRFIRKIAGIEYT